jgi:hypothetical protein
MVMTLHALRPVAAWYNVVETRAGGRKTMSEASDYHFERLQEAFRSEPPDTPLGKAIAPLREPFVLGDGDRLHYEKFIIMFVAIRNALHEIDSSISPELPPFLLHPASIANVFHIPLEKFNYQGGSTTVAPSIIKRLKETFGLLEANPPILKLGKFNDTEKKLVRVLGDDTLTAAKLAERANYRFNANIKQTLSSLVKRGILANKGSGYYRL